MVAIKPKSSLALLNLVVVAVILLGLGAAVIWEFETFEGADGSVRSVSYMGFHPPSLPYALAVSFSVALAGYGIFLAQKRR